jgi:hypothetical protein
MFVAQMSYYIQCSVLSTVLCNHGRSWNILPVDTRAHLYKYSLILNKLFVKEVTFCGMMQVWCGVSWRRRRVCVCNGEG